MHKVNKLTLSSPKYPLLLKEIPDPPSVLYAKGNLSLLQSTSGLGVVGSRKATSYGRGVIHSLVRPLDPTKIMVVSGLALGIDSTAHHVALEAHIPTIAVLPCGLDVIYPSSHTTLAQRILNEGGALVSEYANGKRPMRHHFIQRNRIVSGLSKALLVVEASEKSGTLHTVRFALEQGRSVMAVPGDISKPSSIGTNNLIAQGARITTSYQDIYDELGINEQSTQHQELFGANEEELVILRLLQAGNSDGQTLFEKSQLTNQIFQQTMTMLEISGKIQPTGANKWTIR